MNFPMPISYFYTKVYTTIEKECLYKNTCTQKNLICFIFDKKKILSIGANYLLPTHVNSGSIHAEVEAFRTLKKNNSAKIKKINIFVTRFAIVHGKIELKLSKPCFQCLHYMKNIANMKRYKIQDIFYIKENSELHKSSLDELLNDNHYYVTSFQLKNNNNKQTKRNLIF
jgi:hypothetical protein